MASSKSTTKKKSTSSSSARRSSSSSRSGNSSSHSRSSSSRSGSSSSHSRSSSSSRSGSKGKKNASRPLRREIASLVCLLLCIFTLFGYSKSEAFFIKYFCGLLKGLFGYGFWLVPPAFLVASIILMFHRGRPVRARLVSTSFFPFLFGGMMHILMTGSGEFILTQGGELWRSGWNVQSGGVLSGWFAILFSKMFSRIGAALLFLFGMLICEMIITRTTPTDVFDFIRSGCWAIARFVRERPAYEPYEEEEYEEDYDERYDEEDDWPYESEVREYRVRNDVSAREETRERSAPKSGHGVSPPPSRRRRTEIDIPLDDDFVPEPESDSGVQEENFYDDGRSVPFLRESDEEQEENSYVPEEKFSDSGPDPDLDSDLDSDDSGLDLDSLFGTDPEKEKPGKSEPSSSSAPPSGSAAAIAAIAATLPQTSSDQLKRSEAAVAAARARMGAADTDGTYEIPPVFLLKKSGAVSNAAANEELRKTRELLDDTIQSFGIDARIINVTRGPSVTRYELELMRGVKLNKLTNLANDIALSLGASSVRIAPITGRNSVVGVEVPNQLVTPVPLRDVIDSREFLSHTSKVAFAVGKDISGKNIVGDIAKLPHMLIAGTTGSGKSVCTNSLIISLLYKSSPDDVRLIMVDPKMVELGIYNGIPHLLIPVVTDPKKAAGALQWAVTEMMKRYRLFSEIGVRDLTSYNAHAVENGNRKLPQIVVVIDELADLMLVAAKEVEESICRVAQMGRAAGMHLIIATQRPSSDVITGLMKANIPSRIAFAVASSLESRIILDTVGAEKLVGKGDMLYAPLGIGKPIRVQGCMISDEEVASVVEFIKEHSSENYDDSVIQEVESNAQKTEKGGGKNNSGSTGVGSSSADETGDDADELLPAAVDVVVETGMASVSMLQRRLKLGYSRAARLVDQMEERKIVGPFEGSKPRQVLITKDQWEKAKQRRTGSGVPSASEDEFAAALAMSEAADADAGISGLSAPTDDFEEDDAPF